MTPPELSRILRHTEFHTSSDLQHPEGTFGPGVLVEIVERGLDQAIYVREPDGDRQGWVSEKDIKVCAIYLTSYCNHGHYLNDGKPVDHECHVLPPRALQLEREGAAKPLRTHRGLLTTDFDGSHPLLVGVVKGL